MLSSLCAQNSRSIDSDAESEPRRKMAERPVLVGLIPQTVVLDPGDQVSWISDAGNLRVEFDANRCPFSSNIFQAPAGIRLLSGPPRAGSKAATVKSFCVKNRVRESKHSAEKFGGERQQDSRTRSATREKFARRPRSRPARMNNFYFFGAAAAAVDCLAMILSLILA